MAQAYKILDILTFLIQHNIDLKIPLYWLDISFNSSKLQIYFITDSKLKCLISPMLKKRPLYQGIVANSN
jgi:hypothetical protein